MRTKTVFVNYYGKQQEVKVPCNGNESYEELQEAAVRMLKAKEDRESKEESDRLLKELGICSG